MLERLSIFASEIYASSGGAGGSGATASGNEIQDPCSALGGSCVSSLGGVISNVLKIVYPVIGVALFGYFLYGGYLWLTSTGDPDKLKKATDTMLNAAIGAVIVVFAYLATRIVGGVVGLKLI